MLVFVYGDERVEQLAVHLLGGARPKLVRGLQGSLGRGPGGLVLGNPERVRLLHRPSQWPLPRSCRCPGPGPSPSGHSRTRRPTGHRRPSRWIWPIPPALPMPTAGRPGPGPCPIPGPRGTRRWWRRRPAQFPVRQGPQPGAPPAARRGSPSSKPCVLPPGLALRHLRCREWTRPPGRRSRQRPRPALQTAAPSARSPGAHGRLSPDLGPYSAPAGCPASAPSACPSRPAGRPRPPRGRSQEPST